METILMNTENSKANESYKLVLNLKQAVGLRSSNEIVALQNLSCYYIWENIKQQYKNNKLKIIAPTWNDEFELPDGSYSVSDIQDYIEFIIKNVKHYPLILLFIFTSIGLIIEDVQNKRWIWAGITNTWNYEIIWAQTN